MSIKGNSLIKIVLTIFIISAVYLGHKEFFDGVPQKIKKSIPNIEEKNTAQHSKSTNATEAQNSEMLNFKFSSKKSDSLVGDVVSGTLNKILETPKGRAVLKEVLQKMMRQSHEIAGQDLFLSRFLVHDITTGKGKKAMCGDRVEVLYDTTIQKNNSTKKKKMSKTIVTIGEDAIGVNLENGIIGMKEGGYRTVAYPNTSVKTTKVKSNAISTTIQLLSIKNKRIRNSSLLGRPFFDKVEAQYSSGTKLICGDKVKGSYVLSDLKGNILYDSKKSGKNFTFKIGDNKIPAELSNALIGLPTYKAAVSFIALPANTKNSFSKVKNFIPKLSIKDTNSPVILNFKLRLHGKI